MRSSTTSGARISSHLTSVTSFSSVCRHTLYGVRGVH